MMDEEVMQAAYENPFAMFNSIAFAKQYLDTRDPVALDELFEDFQVISELEEVPTGYVEMFTAEFSKPARILIGRPVAKVWRAWGDYTRRGYGTQKHHMKSIAPFTLTEDLAGWKVSSSTGIQALVAVTPTPLIPMPAALEGWELRGNTRSSWIDWK